MIISKREILSNGFGELIFMAALIAGCQAPSVQPAPSPIVQPTATPEITATPAPKPAGKITVSWETNHPERAAWTKALVGFIERDFAKFDAAKDFTTIRPDYRRLTKDQRVAVWAEFISQLAKYESGWNPKSASVDVGTSDNKNTWSVGLLQMSVVDQKNWGINLGFTYNDFLDPIKNLDFGLRLLAKQIDRRGLVLIPKSAGGVYWATLCPGGRYDKTALIAKAVQAKKF